MYVIRISRKSGQREYCRSNSWNTDKEFSKMEEKHQDTNSRITIITKLDKYVEKK